MGGIFIISVFANTWGASTINLFFELIRPFLMLCGLRIPIVKTKEV